jgi:hypothetical protein
MNSLTCSKYYVASFIAGLSAKLYDDIQDNIVLKKYKYPFLEELLKGIHYVLFTIISLEDNMFFLLSYVSNLLNYISNNEAFSSPYEYSLFFSFLFVFLFLNRRDILTTYSNISFYDTLIIISLLSTNIIEPFLFTGEYSFIKLVCRLYFFIFSSVVGVLPFLSKTIRHILLYFSGYFFVSVIVQYISLYLYKEEGDDKNSENNENKEKNKNSENNENKENNKNNENKEIIREDKTTDNITEDIKDSKEAKTLPGLLT